MSGDFTENSRFPPAHHFRFELHLPDFRLFVSFRTVENARFTRIECRLTDLKNGSVSGPNRGVSGGALRSIEKKFFITSIFIFRLDVTHDTIKSIKSLCFVS